MEDKNSNPSKTVSRRTFMKTSATGLAMALAGRNVMFAAGAPRAFRVALLGCGGRGRGALGDCVKAAEHLGVNLQVAALADWFKDKSEELGLKYNVPASRCFGGADAYKKLLETNAEIVLMATPPNFRPVHFEAAIRAGKHVFMEKPVAVDPPGARRVMAAGDLATTKGLAVVAGTQRRHQRAYRRNAHAVHNGAIGAIRGGCIWWCGGALWYQNRRPGESDADYMVRNWVSFTQMSGDHIVEQHVHNIDVANWFIGHPPVTAIGFGGRARRKTGNQFDFFSVEFDYASDLHIHSMCRQIDGCYNRVQEHFVGSEDAILGEAEKLDSGKNADAPDFPEFGGPYVQEHIDLLTSIIEDKPLNEARNVAQSTLAGIMGRISAYTGKVVRWSDLVDNENSPWYGLTLRPTADDFETGQVVAPPEDVVAIPGTEAD